MPRTRLSLVLLAVFALAAGLLVPSEPARAEKVDMSPEQLKKTATHVVTGEVVAIYERTAREGRYIVTRRVAEVRIDAVEKGEGLAKGGLVYVRYWTRKWAGRGHMPPGTTGHRGLPAEKARIRVYLAKNAYDGFGTTKDGGFNVIGANGFEALP